MAIPLACFTGSKMVADSAGKDTSSVADYWRVKTYTKPKDMNRPPWEWDFHWQPFGVAQDVLGGTWNDYNKCFVIQVPKCNLNCPYCFVDKDILTQEGKEFTCAEVYDMWVSAGAPPLFRISGGEPSLYAENVHMLAQYLLDRTRGEYRKVFIWIDTNLTGDVNTLLGDRDSCRLTPARQVVIHGCFKAMRKEDFYEFTKVFSPVPGDFFDKQFANARYLIEHQPFTSFYVTCLMDPKVDDPGMSVVKTFFDRLREEVDDRAPLVTTPIVLKAYECNKRAHEWLDYFADCGAEIRGQWRDLCLENYPPELTWLPSHQVLNA